MEFEIFFLVLVLLFVASLQDFKRREIDVWLNLFIFFCGFSYLIFKSFLYGEISFLVNFSFLLIFVFILVRLIYFAKIFSGGDCALFFCLTPFFVSVDFFHSFKSFFLFFVALFVLGSFYGFFWSFFLFLINFKNLKKKVLSKNNIFIFLLIFSFFVLGIFFIEFLFFSLLFFVLFFSYIFLYLEKDLFVKYVSAKELKEGDWLEKDLRVSGKIIKSSFDGLTKKEIYFLRRHLNRVKVKDGIPYAFSFFLAWIFYYFSEPIKEFLVLLLGF